MNISIQEMTVLTWFDFAVVALIGATGGAFFALKKAGAPQFARIRPAILVALALSCIPALIYLLSTSSQVVRAAWPVLDWLFVGLCTAAFAFLTFGLPFVAGALIPPLREEPKNPR